MSDSIPLKSVRLNGGSVSWDGPSTTTLSDRFGSLTFDPESEVVIAIPNVPTREELIIPKDAILAMVPKHSMRALAVEPQVEQPQRALGSATPLVEVTVPAEDLPQADDDTLKYIKDPITGQVVQVKA